MRSHVYRGRPRTGFHPRCADFLGRAAKDLASGQFPRRKAGYFVGDSGRGRTRVRIRQLAIRQTVDVTFDPKLADEGGRDRPALWSRPDQFRYHAAQQALAGAGLAMATVNTT